MEERLQKLISACGVASRRTAEEYIEAGRVSVNGKTASLGDKADLDRDEVRVDGTPLQRSGEHTYLLLHKPKGYVTTLSDECGRPTVAGLVSGSGARVWPVGRLDMDSEGLLIMTDDGDLTNLLTHPRHEKEKEYHVSVKGDMTAALPILTAPMMLDGVPLAPSRIAPIGEGQLSIIIHEGKNRQVRRMCAAAGLTVTRLRRVREGTLLLGDLKPGAWRHLTKAELAALKK
jgi:23S rRNA pseudouridine2605 synthase